MTLKLVFDVLSGQFKKNMDEDRKSMARAATAAMDDCKEIAKNDGRSRIRANGFSGRWANALRADRYPKKPVIGPAALVYHRIPYAEVFEQPTVVNGKPLLWIPIEKNLPRNGGKHWTPKLYMQRTRNKLVSVNRPGRPPLLVAAVPKRGRRKKVGGLLSRIAARVGETTSVPVFFGVPVVKQTKSFGIEQACKSASERLPALYAGHIAKELA